MKALFIHQNFPGQFRYLGASLAKDPDWEVTAFTFHPRDPVPGVNLIQYDLSARPLLPQHNLAAETEERILCGASIADRLVRLRACGYEPDVVIAHPGWGEALFVKDVWPRAKLLCYFEFYYRAQGQDVGFDPEYGPRGDASLWGLRLKNLANHVALEACDAGLCPTPWQKSTYPQEYADKLAVVHEGIDTQSVRPHPDAYLQMGSGLKITPRDEVVTFVSRNLEPYRGFHIFMRALPEIQRRRPNALIFIVGGDGVSYGMAPPGGRGYKDLLMGELGSRLDMRRIFFVGRVPYHLYLSVLQVSSVHVYLTYPFVVSWSLLEAMAAGCPVVGSRTAPVEDVIRHEENGLLVNFFSQEEVAAAVDRVLSDAALSARLGQSARKTICSEYDLKDVCLPKQRALIENLIAAGTPRSAQSETLRKRRKA